MNILGIDYGEAKIGLAIATSKFAEPLGVVRFETWDKFVERLVEIIAEDRIEKIIIGLSEEKTAEKTRQFAEKLKKEISIPIEYYDETLSTHEAQQLSKEAGMKRQKRTALEDAFAASVMLQNYLEK